MKYVCIDNSNSSVVLASNGGMLDLTIGKIYEGTLTKDGGRIIVNGDAGHNWIYNLNKFISLSEYRINRINIILE